MNRFAIALFAAGLLSPAIALSDEKTEKTETHEMDGKKTTHTKKVKRSADGKGNEEVKTEIVRKTEVGKANGSGDEKSTKTLTHETDGKTTSTTTTVSHTADGKGTSGVKTETVKKTDATK